MLYFLIYNLVFVVLFKVHTYTTSAQGGAWGYLKKRTRVGYVSGTVARWEGVKILKILRTSFKYDTYVIFLAMHLK